MSIPSKLVFCLFFLSWVSFVQGEVSLSTSQKKKSVKINLIKGIKFDDPPENLGKNINSRYEDLNPIVSPDGKSLFFVRHGHPNNIGDTPYDSIRNNDDIWVSHLDLGGNWQPAYNIGKPLNSPENDFVCSVSPDGNTLLFNKRNFRQKTESGWSEPEYLRIKNFKNKSKYVDFFLANDRKTLLIATEMDDSFGELDLYVCFLQDDGSWSEPLNLGHEINTENHEANPFLAADGKTLYFASLGHPGFGSFDIFMAKRLEQSWQNWSIPQNIGPPINSEEWEGSFTIPASGDYAYFTSNKNSYGESDIFRVKLPLQIKPEPVVLVYGKVYNTKSNETITADITYEKLPEGTEVGYARSSPLTGEYKIVLPSGQMYALRAESKGFVGINENLDLQNLKEYTEINIDLNLAPIDYGQRVRLNNIFFDFNKHELRKESYPELDRIFDFLKVNPSIEIEIAGHTDEIGSAEYNLRLSKKRAEAVAVYLIKRGIEESRILAKGYGENKTIASNDTEDGRQLNRRVEFIILKR